MAQIGFGERRASYWLVNWGKGEALLRCYSQQDVTVNTSWLAYKIRVRGFVIQYETSDCKQNILSVTRIVWWISTSFTEMKKPQTKKIGTHSDAVYKHEESTASVWESG